jgi:hypothetical protein
VNQRGDSLNLTVASLGNLGELLLRRHRFEPPFSRLNIGSCKSIASGIGSSKGNPAANSHSQPY